MLKFVFMLVGIVFISHSQIAVAKGHLRGVNKDEQNRTVQKEVLTQQDSPSSSIDKDQEQEGA